MRNLYKAVAASIFIATGMAYASEPFTAGQWETWSKNPEQSAEKIVTDMNTREKIGQVLMLDIRNWGKNDADESLNITQLPQEIAQVISDYSLGSVVLFRENLINTPQTYRLIQDIQQARSQLPLFIGVDQEGGYVTRLREGTEMPGSMALAATRDPQLAQYAGEIHGSELSALGFNLNFSPVLDVNTNQNNPVIGVRSFGSDIPLINGMSTAYIAGLHQHGMLSTVKHFPGHGNVATDSHFGLPEVPYSESEWRETDLRPFQNAIAQRVDAVMTGHIIVPALDNTKVISKKDATEIGLPATLSKKIITDILRNELQYQGLVLTDAMDMGAIVDNFGAAEAVERALLAGVDIAVMPVHIWDAEGIAQLEQLYGYLTARAEQNPEFAARLQQAAAHVVATKLAKKIAAENKHPLSEAQKVVASDSHKQSERKVAERAITLIKNDRLLPYRLKDNNEILVISDENARNELIRRELEAIGSEIKPQQVNVTTLAFNLTDGTLPAELADKINASDLVLLVTYNLTSPDNQAQKVIDNAAEQGKPLVVISSRNPYDIASLNRVPANIAIYGITGFDVTNNNRNSLEANIKAGIRSLFSSSNDKVRFNQPTGKLPVDIKDAKGNLLYGFGHGLTY